MPVFLEIPENPNCDPMDGQVFQCRTPPRVVTHVLDESNGRMVWCLITGVNREGVPCPATACIVEDSGEGACYLVVGGDWGLRLQAAERGAPWDLTNLTQWGAPYLLLGGEAENLRFAD